MPMLSCSMRSSSMPGLARRCWRWVIHIWRRTSRQSRIMFVHFRMPPCRRWLPSRHCSARLQRTDICRLLFQALPREAQAWIAPLYPIQDVILMLNNEAIAGIASLALFAAVVILPGCSINVKDKDKHGESRVDIKTPVGDIHVNEQPDVRETGLH